MNYFITYGNDLYQKSKTRLVNEAREVGIFDKIRPYSPDDLPKKITQNPLYQSPKGGGYWIWKPYIIGHALSELNDNDILIYTDAGCSVNKHKEWEKYLDLMKNHDILVFRINCINREYTKHKVIDLFTPTNGHMWKNMYMVAGTVLFIKKTPFSVHFIAEWESLCLNSELVSDVICEERKFEQKYFIDHRHDQSLLTALIYKYKDIHPIKIIWNNFEGVNHFNGQAIYASRISDDKKIGHKKICPWKYTLKYIVKYALVLPLRSAKQSYFELANSLSHTNSKRIFETKK